MTDFSFAAVMPQEMGEPVVPQWTQLAPAPVVDRYPIVQGSNLTLQYVSNAYRLCTQGYRYAFVDVINELLEHDPHSRGVVRQRILPVAGARLDVLPADLPKGDPQTALAQKIADEVQRQLSALRMRAQAFGALAWAGTIFGIGGAELDWRKTDQGYELKGLRFIHTRRLNVTNPLTWDVHVWDQGLIGPGLDSNWSGSTSGVYGLRCADFPGKFVLHQPQLAGEYSTRSGEARYTGFYMALKRTVVRATAMDFERTIRPWILGYYNRDPSAKSTDPKFAQNGDIQKLDAAVRGLGLGSLNSAILADTCKVEALRAASLYSPIEFVNFVDEQISKALLGQTFTTQPGAHGNKSAAETAKDGTREILRYDAQCLADTLERDVVYWIVKLNFPGMEERLCPRLYFNIDDAIEPAELMKLAATATTLDMAIDQLDLAKRVGLKLVDPDSKTALRTRLISAGKGPTPPDPNDPQPPEGGDEQGSGAGEGAAKDKPARDTKPAPKKAADNEAEDQLAAE